MNKLTTFFIMSFALLIGCENACEIKEDISNLKIQRLEAEAQGNEAKAFLREHQDKIEALAIRERKVAEATERLEQLQSGGLRYVIKVRCKQSRMSLDLTDHVKDKMNAFDFEIPVDADFYKHVQIGTDIAGNFRVGSFIMKSTASSMTIKVVEKRTQPIVASSNNRHTIEP